MVALRLCEGVLDLTHTLVQAVAIRRGLRQLAIEAGLARGEFGGGSCERRLMPLLRLDADRFRLVQGALDIGTRFALVADLPVELCLSRRGFPGRRQALERRALVRVSKCGFRRREPAFQIAVAPPDVRERRVQIRFACGEALHLGSARFVIVPGRAERRFQLAQPCLEVGRRRRMAELRSVAGTEGLRKFGFDGDSPVQLGIDRGLELALPFGELSGGVEPFLCRTRRGGFKGRVCVHQPTFERRRAWWPPRPAATRAPTRAATGDRAWQPPRGSSAGRSPPRSSRRATARRRLPTGPPPRPWQLRIEAGVRPADSPRRSSPPHGALGVPEAPPSPPRAAVRGRRAARNQNHANGRAGCAS